MWLSSACLGDTHRNSIYAPCLFERCGILMGVCLVLFGLNPGDEGMLFGGCGEGLGVFDDDLVHH
jgi:hypothetical protein